MERNDAQYRTWLEFIGEVLHQPPGICRPYDRQLLELLMQSFNGACATQNFVDTEWADHMVSTWPPDFLPDIPPGDSIPDATRQPLLRWYATTGQTDPQSLGRIPNAVADSRLKGAWDEVVRPWGAINELSIPIQVGGSGQQAYVISRPDRDFTEQELDLARLLQPILTGLALHLKVASSRAKVSMQIPTNELTLREMAILTLLSKGLTAESLARQLNISPRTAGKHLEHIYRKLDVSDRLMAVQRAYQLGLLVPPNSLVNGKGTSYL